MFSSTDAFHRREIRSQTRERAIVFNLSSQSIISSSNSFMFSFFINRIIELSNDVQFENFDEIDDFVIFDDVDVSIKYILIFEFLISNTNQIFNRMFVTHFSQNETQRKNNIFSLSLNNDIIVFVIVVNSNTIFKQMKMRIKILKIESKFNDFKISLIKTKTKRERNYRRRRNNNDQYENAFSHIKKRIARFKISNTQKNEN